MAIEKYMEEVIGNLMKNEDQFIDALLEAVKVSPLDQLQLL